MISIIIPAYNEESNIKYILETLCQDKDAHEVIVVDGGSSDKTVEIAKAWAKVIPSCKGRGIQLNRGAREAQGNILFFLHGDCHLETGALAVIKKAVHNGYIGGCLSQRIKSPNPIYRIIEWTGNKRAALRNIFYGDQGIFVQKKTFEKLGGFKEIPLFEDIEFSERLRLNGKTIVLSKKIYTSSRRWKHLGILKTTFVNRSLLNLYRQGVSPIKLARLYRNIR